MSAVWTAQVSGGWVVSHTAHPELTELTLRPPPLPELPAGPWPPTADGRAAGEQGGVGATLPVVLATRRAAGLKLTYGLEEAGRPGKASLLAAHHTGAATQFLALDAERVAQVFMQVRSQRPYSCNQPLLQL